MPSRSARPPMTSRSHSASAREAFDGYAGGRCESIEQGETVQAFLETAREVIHPALRRQAAPLADLLHGHAQDQHLVHQSCSVCAELAFDPVEPDHRPSLPFRDRLPHLAAVDALSRRIDRPGAALRLLPIALERTTAAKLRFVDLTMRMQLGQDRKSVV